jgi:hypothetical protein
MGNINETAGWEGGLATASVYLQARYSADMAAREFLRDLRAAFEKPGGTHAAKVAAGSLARFRESVEKEKCTQDRSSSASGGRSS